MTSIFDLNSPKDAAEVPGLRLKAKNLLSPGTNFSQYWHCEQDLTSYFSEDGSVVYCKDISGIISWFGVHYSVSDWRLFVYSSQSSLQGVLLHNGNAFASISVAHSIHLRETCDSLKCLLNSVNYKGLGWFVCGDLKLIALLLVWRWATPSCPVICARGIAAQRASTGKDTTGHQENLSLQGQRM
jgi:hypothetical protein